MKLEVCANSYASAINAQNAGAHRIELCAELSVGGITPSYGLLIQVVQALDIPIFVLIRPRSGNFMYSEAEFEQMKTDIQVCKDVGCQGIVSGVLNTDFTIDTERTKQLIELAKPMEFTFHRAFDCVPDPFIALEQLIVLGANRLLTSGQESTAELGIDSLKQLKKRAKGAIGILPGSGINASNAALFKFAEFQEIHASASKPILTINRGKYFEDTVQSESNIATIKSILNQNQ
jgi:copper homeostasis protein